MEEWKWENHCVPDSDYRKNITSLKIMIQKPWSVMVNKRWIYISRVLWTIDLDLKIVLFDNNGLI